MKKALLVLVILGGVFIGPVPATSTVTEAKASIKFVDLVVPAPASSFVGVLNSAVSISDFVINPV